MYAGMHEWSYLIVGFGVSIMSTVSDLCFNWSFLLKVSFNKRIYTCMHSYMIYSWNHDIYNICIWMMWMDAKISACFYLVNYMFICLLSCSFFICFSYEWFAEISRFMHAMIWLVWVNLKFSVNYYLVHVYVLIFFPC